MLKPKDENAQRIIKYFNEFSPDKMEILDLFYDSNIEFLDPAVKLKGLPDLKEYYLAVYKNVKTIDFKFHEILKDGETYCATYTLSLLVKGLNGGKKYSVEGMSVLKFNKKNLLSYHRDYIDLGAMVYEKLPVIGTMIRLMKKQLAHGFKHSP